MPRLDIRPFEAFWPEMKRTLDERQPASLVRFGDGEGMFLGEGEDNPPHRALIMRVWFGDRQPSSSDTERLVTLTRTAFQNATFLGFHHITHRGTLFEYARRAAQHHGLFAHPERFISANAHIQMRDRNKLPVLLKKRDFVGLIGGRDVRAVLQRSYQIERIDQFLVPPEAKFSFANGYQRHYPDRFEEIRRLIEVPYRGALFLVGAGLLGKIYCEWIRERGGIALDIGSIFDEWSGLVTRRYIEERAPLAPRRYCTDHALLLADLFRLGPPDTYHTVLTHLRTYGYEDLALLTAFAATCVHPYNAALRTRFATLCRSRKADARALEEIWRARAIDPGFAPARDLLEEITAEQTFKRASASWRWLRARAVRRSV